MNFKYTPCYSLKNYIPIKIKNQLFYTNHNIGKTIPIIDTKDHTVFKEIYLQDSSENRKEGLAVFQVVFHSPMNKIRLIFEKSDFSFPFFIGLPGFCNKKFLINEKEKTFAGYYEWETVECAKNYARSFATSMMARGSKPYSLTYQIIDKTTGNVIEKKEVL